MIASLAIALAGGGGGGNGGNALGFALSLAANSEMPKPRARARAELASLSARSEGGLDISKWDSSSVNAPENRPLLKGTPLTTASRTRKRRNRAAGGKLTQPEEEQAITAHLEDAMARQARGGPAPAALASTSTAPRAAKQLFQNSMAGLGAAEIGKSIRHANVDSLYPIPLSDVACSSGAGGRGLPRTVGHKFSAKPIRRRNANKQRPVDASGQPLSTDEVEVATAVALQKKPLSYQKAVAWSSADMREPAQWDLDKKTRAQRGVKALVIDGAREANSRWMARVRATRAARTKQLRKDGDRDRHSTPGWPRDRWTTGFASAENDGMAGVWLERVDEGGRVSASSSCGSQRHRSVLLGHDGPVTCVALSPDGSIAVTGGEDATIRLWDSRSTPPVALAVLRDHGAATSVNTRPVAVLACALAPAGNAILSGASDATMRLWRVGGGSEAGPASSGTVSMPTRVEVTAVAFSGEGALAAAGDSSGCVMLCRVGWKQHQGAGGTCAHAEALVPLLRFCAVPSTSLPPMGSRALGDDTPPSSVAAVRSLWFGFNRPATGTSGSHLKQRFEDEASSVANGDDVPLDAEAMGECELFTSLRPVAAPTATAEATTSRARAMNASRDDRHEADANCSDANCQWLVSVPSSEGFRVYWPPREGKGGQGGDDAIMPMLMSAFAGQGSALAFGYLNGHNTNAGGGKAKGTRQVRQSSSGTRLSAETNGAAALASPGRAAQPFAVVVDGLRQERDCGTQEARGTRDRTPWRQKTDTPDCESSDVEVELADNKRLRRPRVASGAAPSNGVALQFTIVEAGRPCGGRAELDACNANGDGSLSSAKGPAASPQQQRRLPKWRPAASLRTASSTAGASIGVSRKGASYSCDNVQHSADGLETPCAALSATGIVVTAGLENGELRIFSPATLVASARTGHGQDSNSSSRGAKGADELNAGLAEVGAVAVSRNGLVIATASADGTVRMWDTSSLARGTAKGGPASSSVDHHASLSSGLDSPVDPLVQCMFARVRTQGPAQRHGQCTPQTTRELSSAHELVSISRSGFVRFHDAVRGNVLRTVNAGGAGGGAVASVHLTTTGSDAALQGCIGGMQTLPPLTQDHGVEDCGDFQPPQHCLSGGLLTHVSLLLTPASRSKQALATLLSRKSKKSAKKERRAEAQRTALVAERGIRVLWADAADAANMGPTVGSNDAGKRDIGARHLSNSAQRAVWTGGVPRAMATCPMVVLSKHKSDSALDTSKSETGSSPSPFRRERARAAFNPGTQDPRGASEAVVVAFAPGHEQGGYFRDDRFLRISSVVPPYLLPDGGVQCSAEQDYMVRLPSLRPAVARHPVALGRTQIFDTPAAHTGAGFGDVQESATIDALQFSPNGRALIAACVCRRPVGSGVNSATSNAPAVSRLQLLVVDCFAPSPRQGDDACIAVIEASLEPAPTTMKKAEMADSCGSTTNAARVRGDGFDSDDDSRSTVENGDDEINCGQRTAPPSPQTSTLPSPPTAASAETCKPSSKQQPVPSRPLDPILSLCVSPCGSRALTYSATALATAPSAGACPGNADLQPQGHVGEVLLWGLTEALGTARKVLGMRQEAAAVRKRTASAHTVPGLCSDDGDPPQREVATAPICLRGHSAGISHAVWR